MQPGNRRLTTVVFETTLRCDQACVFCGSRAGARAAGELTTDEFRRAVEQAAGAGAESIELSGGETYLRSDWLDLVRIVKDSGLECAMITGGRALDDEKARLAKEAGLDRASVSIDGLAATHDALRGAPGGFDRALRAIAALRDADIPAGCNTQLNAKNFGEVGALADVLLDEHLYAWQIQILIPMGRAAENEALWLQPYQMLDVVPLVAEVIERCADRGLKVYAGDNIGYFGPHEAALRKWSSRRGHTVGCAAGVLALGIDPAGNVRGCSSLDAPELSAGNVREGDLVELWESSPVLRMMEDFDPAQVWGFCATCYYASVCRGGCTATAIALTGRRGNNPYCHHRALELARAGMRERLAPRGLVRRGWRGLAELDLYVEPSSTQHT